MSKEENKWLSRLRPGLSTVEDLNVLAEEYKDKHENPLYSTYMDVIMRANPKRAKEGARMCQALIEIFDELYAERVKEEVEKENVRASTMLIIEMIRKKISKNRAEEQIVDELEIEQTLVKQICNIFRELSSEASNEDIYKKWSETFAQA